VIRTDFQKLAEMRIREAGILLKAGEFDGAYYIAGYAVEFALKACIIKRKLGIVDAWPDKRFTEQCHTHDLKALVKLADLEADLNLAGAVAAKWLVVKDWSEQRRFEHGTLPAIATQFYDAFNDPVDGVLQWLKARW
jgi:hypothetical protein